MNPGSKIGSIPQKVGQLFFVGISGPVIDNDTRTLLDKVDPGGICLFSRNIKEARQTRELLDEIRGRSDSVPLLSLDQEGGLVDRLRRVITPMPAANLFSRADLAGEFGKIVAEIIRILGFNMDFAPVVDVVDEKRESVTNGLFSRAFGRNAEESAEYAGAFLDELQKGGCLGCVKHFPGLGASMVDSHEELPRVNISEQELHSVDLVPYQRLLERGIVHSVMVAHAAFPNIGLQDKSQDVKLLPSSLDRSFITDLLRTELRFDGLVITDDLEMGAILKNFGIGEACVLALDAGADMLAICADKQRIVEGYQAVLAAVDSGRLTEDRVDRSLLRIASAKSMASAPLPFDSQRLAELSDEISRLSGELH